MIQLPEFNRQTIFGSTNPFLPLWERRKVVSTGNKKIPDLSGKSGTSIYFKKDTKPGPQLVFHQF